MQSHWTHLNPVKVIAGQNSLDNLTKLLASIHRPENTRGYWLLITTRGFTRRGVTAHVQKLVGEGNLVTYDCITPNPGLDELDQCTAQFKTSNIQGIIALGGGSVLDAAKVLSVTLVSSLERPLNKIFRENQLQYWQDKIPVIAIPTTSGTGAEVTPFATVWDTAYYKKHSVIGDKVYPDIAILDPNLTITLPQNDTLYTGLDTLSHALESLWNKKATPVSEALALRSLALATEALPVVLEKPSDLVSREKMQQASLLAGLAISQTQTAIAHSISYPLTSYYGIIHGLACSFTLPAIIEYCIERRLVGKEVGSRMAETKLLLDSLKLREHLSLYVTLDEVLALENKMIHPDRADNFKGVIELKKLIQSSL